jgi:hypothetical protein
MTRRDALIEFACRRIDVTRVTCAPHAPGAPDRPARGAAYPSAAPRRRPRRVGRTP